MSDAERLRALRDAAVPHLLITLGWGNVVAVATRPIGHLIAGEPMSKALWLVVAIGVVVGAGMVTMGRAVRAGSPSCRAFAVLAGLMALGGLLAIATETDGIAPVIADIVGLAAMVLAALWTWCAVVPVRPTTLARVLRANE